MKPAQTIAPRKTILFFLPLPPPIHGAALRNKSLVESRLINDQFDIQVVPFNFAQNTYDIGKPSFLKVLKFINRAFTLTKVIVRQKPDLIYFNISLFGFALYRDFCFVILFKLFKLKIVYHLRTQGVNEQAEKSHVKKMMFKCIFRNTSVICLSEFLTRDIRNVYFERPFVVNNGIKDVSHLYPRLSTGNPTVTILFISNLAKTKGIIELVEAFKILQSRGNKFSGLIVGSPFDLGFDDIQRKIDEYELTKNVVLLGPRYGSEKFNILSNADIFVLPTYFEAFPGAILEAMQFSIPVVSTHEGAIPEIVDHGKTGFVVEKYDVEQLAIHIELLIKDQKLRQQFGRNARAKFVRQYTFESFEKNMVFTFHQILHHTNI